MAETDERTDPAADEQKQLRNGLIDQLRHLVREVDMLEGVIGRVPEKLLVDTPPGASEKERSIKETFGLIARLDEAVHARRVRRVVDEDAPRFSPPDPEALLAGETNWNAQPMATLFERVRSARRGLIDTLKATAPDDWLRTGRFPNEETDENTEGESDHEERDLYWMVHRLCQRDAARLERMTRRLYESHMGPRPEERKEEPE
jgi:hypothetical protein